MKKTKYEETLPREYREEGAETPGGIAEYDKRFAGDGIPNRPLMS